MLGKIKYYLKKSISTKMSYFLLLGIVSIFLIVGGFSYALFTTQVESLGSLNVVTGNLYSLIESNDLEKNKVTLNGKESKVITVTLKNVNTITSKLNLWYEAEEGVNVSYDTNLDTPPKKEGEVLESNTIKTYKIKLVNTTDNAQTITFGSEAGLYNRDLSFPIDKKVVECIIPKVKIDDAMIKVVYNETKKEWEKASNDNWYDYDLGQWANAVTVTTATRSTYQSANAGTTVSMNDIETMWVWIPRYSYTIGSEDGTNYYGKQGTYLNTSPTQALPGEIDVKFIKKEEKETGNAQYLVSSGVSEWRTPDAFTFGDEELSGIWVGKFETSSSTPNVLSGGGNTTELDVMIKPNVISWRGIQVSNIASIGRKVSVTGNRYGLSNLLNSHAMKNSEWGAVSYLSQSKYGKLGNRDFSGANKEIYQNMSGQYVTGCSCGTPGKGTPGNPYADYGCHYNYNVSLTGTGASTTGNITGIYDLNGGSWEYVLGNYTLDGNKYTGTNQNDNSGYTGLLGDGDTFSKHSWLDDKYYNFYIGNNYNNSCDGKSCLSHAFNETTNWYNDISATINEQKPWVIRGGGYDTGVGSGIFYYASYSGNIREINSFRLILSAT